MLKVVVLEVVALEVMVLEALTNSSSLSCPNHRHTSAVFQPSTSEGTSEIEVAGANVALNGVAVALGGTCLLYTSPSPRDLH